MHKQKQCCCKRSYYKHVRTADFSVAIKVLPSYLDVLTSNIFLLRSSVMNEKGLEKAFDRVPRDVLWWSMRKLGIEEWVIKTVKAMYANARSQVRINNSYSSIFNIQVGVHQGSVLSPLLFIIAMEAFSREFRCGFPWDMLYADNLIIMAESLEKLIEQFTVWKDSLESKGLQVNMAKTKIMCSNFGLVDFMGYPIGVLPIGVSKTIKV